MTTHRSSVSVVFTLLAALLATLLLGPVPAEAATDSDAERTMSCQVDALRRAHGLTPHRVASDLTRIARDHAKEMARQNRLHHNPHFGSQVTGWTRVAENVGVGPSITSIQKALEASTGHRQNLLDGRMTEIGIGVERSGDRLWVVQLFRQPSGSAQGSTASCSSISDGRIPVMGDWNGDGEDTPGWFYRGTWHLRNSHSAGPADITLTYGRRGDTPVVGDWNGNGIDTIGVVRTDADGRLRFILRYEYRSGADIVMHYGRQGDVPVTGDWNGNGIDTIGVVRTDADGRLRFILRYEYRSGADIVMHYGNKGDNPVVGDFNGDGTDTLGVRRGNRFILRYVYRSGADIVLDYGRTTDTPVIGDYNGDDRATLGVVRDGQWILRYIYRSGADYVYRY